jgi:hypothetical protein
MFINKNKLLIALGSILLSSNACKKIDEFGNINQNPGNTTQPVTSSLLTNVLSGIGSYTWDAGGVSTSEGLYAQYFAETQYTDISRYAKNSPDWTSYYAGALYDLQTIINYNSNSSTAATAAANGSNANQIATARILKAYIFLFLTDAYGDIPYKGALKGDNGIVVFDTQQSIYTDIFKELKEAVAQFDNGLTVKGDILFSGNTTKWKKFANSIHALAALRLSKVDPTTGKQEFVAALASDGAVVGAGENYQLVYPGGTFLNPVYNFYYGASPRVDYAVSKTLTDILTATNDKRINAFASSSIGFPYGLTRNDAVAFANANVNWAKILAPSFVTATSPINILTAADVYLARAEAAQLGWTNEDAQSNYQNGILESWKLWNVYNATDFNSYIAQASITLTGQTNSEILKRINTQQWVSHYPNGNLGFSDWRRTGYPALSPAPGQAAIPRRLSYSSTEYNLNGTNTTAAAAKYTVNGSTDSQLGKLWWDK